MGTRQAGNLLTKASWVCGGVFIFIAYVLEVSASRGRTPTSVLDRSFAPTKTAPAQPAAPPSANAPAVPLQVIPDAKDAAKKADAKKTPEPPTKKP